MGSVKKMSFKTFLQVKEVQLDLAFLFSFLYFFLGRGMVGVAVTCQPRISPSPP